MRRLAEPEVVQSALTAAVIGAVLCLPRVWVWTPRKYPLWYLETLLFLGGTVLWGFVFAWHSKYAHRPVINLRIDPKLFAGLTVGGIALSLILCLWFDPTVSARSPEDYPKSLFDWVASTLFSLAFTQLFLIFAPFAWLMRLFQNQRISFALTIIFGVFVLLIRQQSSASALPPELLVGLVALRMMSGTVALWVYLRGGALLVWWWILLLQARHLLVIVRG